MTTTQPIVLNSMRTTVEVERNQFMVYDAGDWNEPPPYDAQGWYQVGETGARFVSGGSDHFPDVLMESWSAEPPPVDNSWELSDEHQVFLPTATARLWGLFVGPSPDVMALTPGRQWFHLRASVRGQETIQAISTDTSLWPVRDVEHWLLQFW